MGEKFFEVDGSIVLMDKVGAEVGDELILILEVDGSSILYMVDYSSLYHYAAIKVLWQIIVIK